MKPTSPYVFHKNNSCVVRTPSPHLKGLNAHRGSPKQESRWNPFLRRLAVPNKVLVSVWLLVFPFVFISLQWKMHEAEIAVYKRLNETSFLPPTAPRIGSDEDVEAITRPRIRSPEKSPNKEELSGRHIESFDPAFHHIIPRSVYEPKSSNPLQVMYIGRTTARGESSDDAILDALERSRYIQVAATFMYKNSVFYQELWHSFRSLEPAAIVVDWSALQRDCHVLHRILSHINKHRNFLHNHNETYLLLLDSTASTRIVTCPENVSEFIPKERIRVAKRSIVEGRLWNYTKQWVEPGKCIPNVDDGILHATGSVGEDFVEQLRVIGVNNRTIDVSHFWQASSAGDSNQYYYSFLRRSISSALNHVKSQVDQRRDEETSTWLDRVGVGSEEPEEMHSSADDDDTALDLHLALLAASKIVIVSQNDEWEDHDDRLMEALATGAMVLSDTMIAPPPGLRNKTNIVFYDSVNSLEGLLHYYLHPDNEKTRETIARHGVEYALGRHRAWHVLEALLFGKALTLTDKKPLDQQAPAKRMHSENETVVTVAL